MKVPTGRFILYFTDGREQIVDNEREAHRVAQEHVGNRSYTKPFPNEPTYLYGPGDGTTIVTMRRERVEQK